MAGGTIKGITISFNGDTTKLDKALRQINKETRDIDKDLKQVDKALKFNPTSVELWRQKQDLITKKVAETKTKLDTLKQAQAKMDAEGVDKNSDEYRKLQREIIVTENQVKNFEGQLRKVGNVKLRAASEQVKEVGNKLTAAGEAMKGVSMAAAGVVAGLGAISYKAGKAADDLNTMSKVTGIGTQDLQKYKYAADLVDVSVEAIAKSNKKLATNAYNAANGSKSQAEAFDKLGVSVTDADGNLRDSDAIFQDTITALGQMENETERNALAQKLMGKSASELNPLIEDGGETYKMVADTLQKYNLDYVDQETLDKANQFNDELDTMKLIGSVAIAQVGSELAATLAPALEKVVDLVGRFAEWLGNLDPRLLTVIGSVAGIIAVLAPVLLFLGKMAFAISSIMSLVATIGPAIGAALAAAAPIVAVIAGIIAIGVLLYKNWDAIKARAKVLVNTMKSDFQALKTIVTNVWNGIKTAITTAINAIRTFVTNAFNGIKSTVSRIWNGIKTAITNPIQTAVNLVRAAINKIKSIINGAHLSLPKFKLPHFKISGGKLPWGIGGKGTPPKINVDWYAQGGIFDNASIIGVGEAGSEAVVPLDRFWNEIGNINGKTDALLARQNAILLAVLEEVSKEKDFKVNGMWAGRYVNSLVR